MPVCVGPGGVTEEVVDAVVLGTLEETAETALVVLTQYKVRIWKLLQSEPTSGFKETK